MAEAVTVRALADVLHEPRSVLLARVVRTLGPERCAELVAEALLIEHQGGLWLQDLGRKRTLGGIFLQLCRERSTPEERRRIFRRRPPTPNASPVSPAPAPFSLPGSSPR